MGTDASVHQPRCLTQGSTGGLATATGFSFAYERPEGDALKLLGSVSKGAQIGALAMTTEGEYVQVVGDQLVPLKTREIAKAVSNATIELKSEFRTETSPWNVARKESAAPVIMVKKRRVAVMP